MIESSNPITQALLGTMMTWGFTAFGAAFVIVFDGTKRKLLDSSLGFAAGVMIAASYWSLLSPAIELAEQSDLYGSKGEFVFVPVAVGFFLGALFLYMVDVFLSSYKISSSFLEGENNSINKKKDDDDVQDKKDQLFANVRYVEDFCKNDGNPNRRKRVYRDDDGEDFNCAATSAEKAITQKRTVSEHWKRMLMLIIAITVHNIPEGLAVGVGFGGVGSSRSATFTSARNLAIGIGIQNFPEGLAVSLPLKAAGFSNWKSFWYGQLSGMVEPVAGLIGAVLVVLATPTLPYALSFAAGAMIYVVVDDIIPEANSSGNGKLATWGCIVGFLIMMTLDVGLG